MRKTMTLLCLFIGICWASAQTKITGTVVSADDGQPVIGATVVAKGTSVGTVTNVDGAFSINVPSSAKTLVFSYVGMVSAERCTSKRNENYLTVGYQTNERSGSDCFGYQEG